ncbi:MAG: hypothetical protein QM680_14555 [Luteolibacter sp.]
MKCFLHILAAVLSVCMALSAQAMGQNECVGLDLTEPLRAA